jgi:hypothetical protein
MGFRVFTCCQGIVTKRLVVDLKRMLDIKDMQYKLVLEDKPGVFNYINAKNKGWNEAMAKIGELLCLNCEEV